MRRKINSTDPIAPIASTAPVAPIDPKAFGKVAVLLGGESAERDISLNSGRLVLQGLRDKGIDAYPFDPKEQPLLSLTALGFVRAFNALHGGSGENGRVQGVLDYLGIRYPGAGVLGCALSMNKLHSKLIWQQTGIPTPAFEIVMRGDDYLARANDIIAKLSLPLFVKPNNEGSSIAVTRVDSASSLIAAIESAAHYDTVILVEKSIEGGAEYTLPIVGKLDLPMIRIVPASAFYDYHAKYIADDTKYLIPCGLSAIEEKRLKALAVRAFSTLDCQDWGRVDLMTDAYGNPYFLEVNTVPGMTDHSLSPKAARAIGIDYSSLVVEVLSLTL